MVSVTDEEFEEMVQAAVKDIPERFAKHLNNVAFMVADEPTRRQLRDGGVHHGYGSLLGLYEGVALPERAPGYSGVVPDIITVFKQPHEAMAEDMEQLRQDVHETVWHEVAHFFGLDHGQIHELER